MIYLSVCGCVYLYICGSIGKSGRILVNIYKYMDKVYMCVHKLCKYWAYV